MPLYEYVCDDCKTRFDALRLMRDADAPIHCSRCQGEHTHRCLSLFNAQSGGKAVAGTQASSCSGCAGGSCVSCGH